jgi:NAD(P)-dependent dehydrogenase (short-subunit alcohol dehydrogenase family)
MEQTTVHLDGLVAVVTGGASGIGRSLAIELARRNATVVIGDVQEASATVFEIEQAGGSAIATHCDVSVTGDIADLHDLAVTEFGSADLVFSNVGVGAPGPLHSLESADFERVWRLSVESAFHTLRAFAPDLIRAAAAGRFAAITFTGSEHSLGVPPSDVPPRVPASSAYTMSKHALLGIAAVARRDLAAAGVRVALLCPGWTATETLRRYAEKSPALRESLEEFAQEPDFVAAFALDRLIEGQHIIATNPVSAEFVTRTHTEILEAMALARGNPVGVSLD